MQNTFDFLRSDQLLTARNALRSLLGVVRDEVRRDPLSQFAYSLISARTYDAVSVRAFENLRHIFPDWEKLAEADASLIEDAICDVTYAERKASYLRAALRMIRSRVGRIDLDFLADWSVELSMRWLMALPGAGPKVAAATLNFSTLRKRAFVVDTHVLRILRRMGLVAQNADISAACETAMASLPNFDADDFYELHWLLKSLGQIICTHSAPQCDACPLGAMCEKRMDEVRFRLLSGALSQTVPAA